MSLSSGFRSSWPALVRLYLTLFGVAVVVGLFRVLFRRQGLDSALLGNAMIGLAVLVSWGIWFYREKRLARPRVTVFVQSYATSRPIAGTKPALAIACAAVVYVGVDQNAKPVVTTARIAVISLVNGANP